ncbi:hypothetical protein SEA_OHMYWARD_15 [Gordonia phage OhMyWard]|uniref:Head-to-tail connector complex protein n=1 Tax=Gordonia phage OhMyWard TaxID=2652414 RepID=A0A5P8D792_9CAUD|nr:virion structural protein [Gordonia phage OhMyWard]QFP94897.1 hypothetical protein SEA_OHMYWARD_15 [Gordonia phage OhMyWard]
MSESILTSTKKILGIAEDYDVFDMDIIMHINGVLSTLHQLGLGPEEGFMIQDDSEEWGDLLEEDMRLNSIKTYIFLKVRLLFDPPTTSFAQTAMQEQVRELEWRLNVYREGRDQA